VAHFQEGPLLGVWYTLRSMGHVHGIGPLLGEAGFNSS
jgi:hypothetical protein